MLAGMLNPWDKLRAQTSECSVVAAPALTEGPYFVDEILHRSDIRMDPSTGIVSQGFPMNLTINLSRVDDCAVTPLAGAFVDIWHCDAAGVYSDVSGAEGKKFLRGYQIADRAGQVNFLTVFPGWYQGRAVHIHFKVRFFAKGAETYEFTSQWFFEDSVINDMYQKAPYNSKGLPDTRNTTDGIYNGASLLGSIQSNSGSHLLLKPETASDALNANFDLVLDVAAGSSPDGIAGGGGPGGMPPGGAPPGPRP